ncbi:MAG TPA: CHAD domain-containing protein [Abditibacteriaceae bacterium]|jgi:CHAD domain-containing protein
MADIAHEAGLLPDETVLTAASKLFIHLWHSAWEHAPQTAGGDADALHDMRVSLRRLRSALQNLEGERATPLIDARVRREFAKQRKSLGKLGDALGAVRDHDVLGDYLREYAEKKLKKSLADLAGLAQLDEYLKVEREAAFGPMVKKINRALKPAKQREEFARWALGLPGIETPPMTLQEARAIILPQRIDDVYAHAFALADDNDAEGHHEFRKSLRRLRYALETLSVCFPENTKSMLKKLVKAQDILGEMQDREVLHQTALRAYGIKATTEKALDEILPPDIAVFLLFGDDRRRHLLEEARAFWQKNQSGGLFDELRAL